MESAIKMQIVMAVDRGGDAVFVLNPSDFDILLGITCTGGGYYLDGQAPGYVSVYFTESQFRQFVNELVYWMLEVDPDYLSP